MNRFRPLKLAQRGKSALVICGGIFLLILLLLPTVSWVHSTTKDLAARHNSTMSPVIMIPGSSATKERFNALVSLLNEGTDHKHSLLKAQVSESGKVTYTGHLSRGDREPIIVVGFQNNHDGYANVKDQARLFNLAFKQLTDDYRFNNFKAFGHSNGGLVWTIWLEKYYAQYADQIKVKTLMTVGTPFNFAEPSLATQTQMLTDLIAARNKIPANLTVFSITGTENYDSDGLVPEQSVEAGKYIYQKRVRHYTAMTVTGDQAQHSDLPQNQQIVALIKQYLLDQPTTNRRGTRANAEAGTN